MLSSCTSCLTPNISVTGNNVIIAGGTPDHGFTGILSPFANVQNDTYGAILGDNLNTTSGTGATLTENPSGVAAVFTIGFISPAPLSITTSSLPVGLQGTAYSATLTATGGTLPYTWTLTSGTSPAGLHLNATTGAITGTPTAAANATPLTFMVTDFSSPAQTKSVNLTMTISPGTLAITTSSLQRTGGNTLQRKFDSDRRSSAVYVEPHQWHASADPELEYSDRRDHRHSRGNGHATPLTFMRHDSGTPPRANRCNSDAYDRRCVGIYRISLSEARRPLAITRTYP